MTPLSSCIVLALFNTSSKPQGTMDIHRHVHTHAQITFTRDLTHPEFARLTS